MRLMIFDRRKLGVAMCVALTGAALHFLVPSAAEADDLQSRLAECRGRGNDHLLPKEITRKPGEIGGGEFDGTCWQVRERSSHTFAVDRSALFGCGGKSDSAIVRVFNTRSVRVDINVPTDLSNRLALAPYVDGYKIPKGADSVVSQTCGELRKGIFNTQCLGFKDRKDADYACIKRYEQSTNPHDLYNRDRASWNARYRTFVKQYSKPIKPSPNKPAGGNPSGTQHAGGSTAKPNNPPAKNNSPKGTPSGGKVMTCEPMERKVTDTKGNTFFKVWNCTNLAKTPMWNDTSKLAKNAAVTNHMLINPNGTPKKNWVACVSKFSTENPPRNNARNNYWAWTWGDESNNPKTKWGWMPLTFIAEGSNINTSLANAGITECTSSIKAKASKP